MTILYYRATCLTIPFLLTENGQLLSSVKVTLTLLLPVHTKRPVTHMLGADSSHIKLTAEGA
jgi:hypothetical protein